ncbi:RCC1 and BTB domain-containing protein 1 [Mycetomoellerius zeteki]|uniref:RCC1 and BTB domain-containing protein 1 n=1 Tax=Mycetomoellerius zeteki TaxID=64791 RepID=UPI00084E8570|nr:PREDICTED: RCC1 and BTB domain-containing protein 1-like [Trachymyrmex zeteki]
MCSKPKKICSSLCSWPIFNSLESQFLSQIHMVLVYGTLGNEALIVTKDKMVYGLGNNVNGCLGIGDEDATLDPKKVEDLCGKDIKTFAYGIGPHVLALTKEGEIYSWGCNDRGQLGTEKSAQVITPILVQIPVPEDSLSMKRIIDIACGINYSVALTEDGKIYTWGDNHYYQLGGSINDDNIFNCCYSSIPKLLNCNLAGKKVVHVSCGGAFTMAITDNGEVYGWGDNSIGQLGIRKNCEKELTPQWIDLEGHVIVKVVCGFQHALALTEQGDIFAWGRNDDGQLGIGTNEFCRPIMINSLIKHETKIKWVDIAALNCSNISVAVSEEGHVYVWGNCHGEKIVTPTVTPFSDMHDAIARYGPSVMHQPLILYANEGPDILQCLKTAFDDRLTSDFEIQVQGKCIYVHKVVLIARCSYFRTMFQHDWACQKLFLNEGLVKPSYVIYKAFLKYLYTDIIDLPLEKASELLDLAEEYCESNLKQHCIQLIKQGITVSNVAYFYRIAVKHNAKDLKDFCIKFAVDHLTAVTQTESFSKLDRITMKTFIIKIGKVGGFKK